MFSGTNQENRLGEDPPPTEQSTTPQTTSNTVKSSDSDAGSSTELPTEDSTGAQSIIETMDADHCVLRQRRLAFYNNQNSDSQSKCCECESHKCFLLVQPKFHMPIIF